MIYVIALNRTIRQPENFAPHMDRFRPAIYPERMASIKTFCICAPTGRPSEFAKSLKISVIDFRELAVIERNQLHGATPARSAARRNHSSWAFKVRPSRLAMGRTASRTFASNLTGYDLLFIVVL